MGVLNFYKKFIKDIVINSQVGSTEEQTVEVELEGLNPYSVLLDANGILYDVANQVYCLGQTLEGRKQSEDIKNLTNSKLKTQEGRIELFVLFSQKLKELLTKNIIELLKPSQVLIIGIDGKAFRAKQKQQRGRRFKSGKDSSSGSFDVGNFTVGTKFLSACCNVIDEWINENRDLLPPYVYFSPCCEEGEAEHKIFSIFETTIDKIENDFKETYKDYTEGKVEKIMKTKNHIVVGKDSDLFFLSLLRYEHNFYWFRDTSAVFSGNQKLLTSILEIRNFIALRMMNESQNNALQCIRDFVLMSFLIGDDFVPGNFCFDIHIGKALLEMMDIYKQNNIKILKEKKLQNLETDLQIDLDELYRFLGELRIVEKEFFEVKAKFQFYEEYSDNAEKGRMLQELSELKTRWNISQNNRFERSSFLDLSYDDFLTEWSYTVICPNYINLQKNQKEFFRTLKSLQEELDDACSSFLTGLQWNISCYQGVKKLSNWVYMWSFAPTIYELRDFLKVYSNFQITGHLDFSRQELNHTSIIMTLFNVNFSEKLINQTITEKKTEKGLNQPVNTNLFLAPTIYQAFNPKNFISFFEGKYYYDKYGENHILPMIPFEMQSKFKSITKVEKNVSLSGNLLEYGKRQSFNKRDKHVRTPLFEEIFIPEESENVSKTLDKSRRTFRKEENKNTQESKKTDETNSSRTYKTILKSFS